MRVDRGCFIRMPFGLTTAEKLPGSQPEQHIKTTWWVSLGSLREAESAGDLY